MASYSISGQYCFVLHVIKSLAHQEGIIHPVPNNNEEYAVSKLKKLNNLDQTHPTLLQYSNLKTSELYVMQTAKVSNKEQNTKSVPWRPLRYSIL